MIAYIRQLTSKRVIAEIKVSFLFLFGSSNFYKRIFTFQLLQLCQMRNKWK